MSAACPHGRMAPRYIEAQDFADTINQKTGQDPVIVVTAVIGIIVPAILLMYGTSLITDFFGVLYPLYMSILTLEALSAGDDNAEKDAKNWLAFWVIVGVVNTLCDTLIFFIPYYTYLKAGLFVVMMLPEQEAPVKIYEFFKAHVAPIVAGVVGKHIKKS